MVIPIPLWGAIVGAISLITPLIWALITMFFTQKETKAIIATIQLQIINQDKLIVLLDDKFENKFDTYRKEFDHKFEKQRNSIDDKLTKINEIVISTKAVVDLIVKDKIKN